METIATKKQQPISVDKNIKDHSNDPFFVKKVKSAKLLFKKFGLAKKIKQLQQE
jgi:hypothetical protein